MDLQRHRWAVGGAALVAAAVATFAGLAWRYDDLVRDVVWPAVAARPLDTQQQARLDACDDLSWWAWLRVLEHDLPDDCGVAWGRDGLAAHLKASGRRAWLQERLTGRQDPVRVRWRIAVALEAAGEAPAMDPGWLLLEEGWPDDARAAVWQHEPVDAFGPRAGALARAWRLRGGADGDATDRWALAMMAQVPGPVAQEAETTASAWLGLPVDEARAEGARLGHRLPEGWVPAMAELAACGGDCAAEVVSMLDEMAVDPDGLGHLPGPPDERVDLGWLGLLPEAHDDALVLTGLLARDAAWVRSGVDPAARLAGFLDRPAAGEGLTERAFRGAFRPAEGLLYVAELARRAGIEGAALAGDGALGLKLGPHWRGRCGAPGRQPVSPEQLAAWALDEAGAPEAARRLMGVPSASVDGARAIGGALRRGSEAWRPWPCPPLSEG